MKFTYKLVSAGEIKELDEAEVVSGHQVEAGMRNTSTVNIGLVSITRPNAENLVTKDAEELIQKHHHCQYFRDPNSCSKNHERNCS